MATRITLPSDHNLTAPRNVEHITKAAQQYEYNAQVPLRYWLRTAAALLKEAEIYKHEGDDETTYLLLFRHAHLILTNLTSHPGTKDKELKIQILDARREVEKNLLTLDALRPRINERYERYMKLIKEREARREAVKSQRVSQHEDPHQAIPVAPQDRVQRLLGHEHQDLAVKLAQQEYSRRAGSRRAQTAELNRQDDGDDLSKRLQSIRARVEPPVNQSSSLTSQALPGRSQDAGYSYPKVPAIQPAQMLSSTPSIPSQQPHTYAHSSRPPSLPPKPSHQLQPQPNAPLRPEKIKDASIVSKPSSEPTYTFSITAHLESGSSLRTLFLPPTLRTTFLRLAYQNTLKNLETCAFLAGTLISNALFVSKLIVPTQTATSDTCEMTNESQLFDYVDSYPDLMILGWIHTHPSQTCFMSSRDLHTHAGYQMMLAESIAMVCAPSKGDTSHGGDWGVFRLTDPPGKMTILNCTKPGVFHPHDVDNVYTDAMKPGHVVEAKGLEFEVVDLRGGAGRGGGGGG